MIECLSLICFVKFIRDQHCIKGGGWDSTSVTGGEVACVESPVGIIGSELEGCPRAKTRGPKVTAHARP